MLQSPSTPRIIKTTQMGYLMSKKWQVSYQRKCTFSLKVELFASDDIMSIGLLRKG